MIGAPSITQQFRALFRPGDYWFDADRVTIDGVTGKVSAIVDHMDASHTLAQTTSANQCAAGSTSSAFGGRRCLAFAGAQFYASTRATSEYTWMHDGSSCFLAAFWSMPTGSTGGRVVSTGQALNDAGWAFEAGAGPVISSWVGNGSTLPVVRVNASTTFDAPHSMVLEHGSARSPQHARWQDGASLGTGGYAAAMSASAPPNPLRIGSRVGATFFTGDWVAFYAIRRLLSASERAVFSAYARGKHGVAA